MALIDVKEEATISIKRQRQYSKEKEQELEKGGKEQCKEECKEECKVPSEGKISESKTAPEKETQDVSCAQLLFALASTKARSLVDQLKHNAYVLLFLALEVNQPYP